MANARPPKSQNGVRKARGIAHNPFVMKLSLRFVLGSILGVSAMAFAVGRLSAVLFLENHPSLVVITAESGPRALPPPLYPEKEIPQTIYSSKQFNAGAMATSETLLARRANFGTGLKAPGQKVPHNKSSTEEGPEEVHEPAGQHLLIDIKSVDGTFLNSEDRLARAMVKLIKLSGLTMLSYHCHGLEPVGVSCVGVLLESHISFHTWPIPGVITLDLFTCGPNPLLPLLSKIEELFGVPRWSAVPGDEVEKPYVQWAHKKRGFRARGGNPEEVDIYQFLLGWSEYDMKKHIASVETNYQTIDIFEIINRRFGNLESYKKSLSNDGSYESKNPDLFKPDRIVYLDGITQSRLLGEAAYHEALVHPAMVSHEDPKRVAIIGGGEGATLREVLKHRTVEKVTMVEIDEIMVQVSREYLPEWSNCSNLVGSAASCFDDPRAEVFFTDAIAWFIERFGDKERIDPSQLYDVIIMDALDPSSVVAFSDILYNNDDLMRALSNALGDKGIFIAQFGEDDHTSEPAAQNSNKNTARIFINHLKQQGFKMVTEYAEGHGGFLGVWSFLIAFKSSETKALWYQNQAEIDLVIRDRLLDTVNGECSLRFFDGATMMAYQYPSRVHEETFCRTEPKPVLCDHGHGFDPDRPNAPISSFEVKQSTIAGAGRGVFLKEDVAKGTYIAIDEGVHDTLVMPETTYLLQHYQKAGITERWKVFDSYLFGYGFESDFFGDASYTVDAGIMKFINHGCNGTNNMELLRPLTITEMTADPKKMPEELENSLIETAIYSPFIRRNYLIHLTGNDVASRDLKAGEELLDSYLSYYSEANWERGVMELRAQCSSHSGSTMGIVSDYEASSK